MSRTSGLVQRDSAITAFGIVNQRGFTEGPQCAGSVEGEGRHGSPSSTAALREVAAGAWEDLGKGEEPVAGVWAGASGVRQGWHLQEGKVTIGRAPNASGSCSPGGSGCRFPGFTSAGDHPGEWAGPASRGGESREETPPRVPLFPCLEESSFLRERKVGRGPWARKAAAGSAALSPEARQLAPGQGLRGADLQRRDPGGHRRSGAGAQAGPPVLCGALAPPEVLAPPALGPCVCTRVCARARARVSVNMCMRTGAHTCVVCVHALVCVGVPVC